MSTDLTQQEWFQHLVIECEAILTEAKFNAQDMLIRAYHAMGLCILAERENFKRNGIRQPLGMVRAVADAMNKSDRTIQYVAKFATKVPDIDGFLDKKGKDISWRRIIIEELTESKTEVLVKKRVTVDDIKMYIIQEMERFENLPWSAQNVGALGFLRQMYKYFWG